MTPQPPQSAVIFDRHGMKCHPGEAASLAFRVGVLERDSEAMAGVVRIIACCYGTWPR